MFLTDTARTSSEYLSIDPKIIHNNRRVSENQTCKKSSIVNLLSFFLSSEFPSLTQDCLGLSSNFGYYIDSILQRAITKRVSLLIL